MDFSKHDLIFFKFEKSSSKISFNLFNSKISTGKSLDKFKFSYKKILVKANPVSVITPNLVCRIKGKLFISKVISIVPILSPSQKIFSVIFKFSFAKILVKKISVLYLTCSILIFAKFWLEFTLFVKSSSIPSFNILEPDNVFNKPLFLLDIELNKRFPILANFSSKSFNILLKFKNITPINVYDLTNSWLSS